jgi:lipoprotein-anchoring transpeptidase ErfK/SrfK
MALAEQGGRPADARGAPARRRAPKLAAPAVALSLLALVLAACTSGGANPPGADSIGPGSTAAGGTSAANHSSSTPSAPQSSTPPSAQVDPGPAVITASPAAGKAVSPVRPVKVAVKNGQLTSVQLVNAAGKQVTGALTKNGTAWRSTEALGYGKTYRLRAEAVAGDGSHVAKRASFTTLMPDNLTMPYIQRMGGYPLTNGATYGIAIVPVVHFDEPITNEAAAQRALTVTTSPHVDGSWYWADDQDAHWRPKSFYAPGTKVTVRADVYGVEVGKGLYGETDAKAAFTIGAKHITIADDNAPKVDKVRVYFNNKLVRTMNTSMGKHSGEEVNGQFISFFTMVGTYTVLEHDNPAIMSSASYGLPPTAPGGYGPEPIYYSTKISTDGVYLHELTTTIWDQDHGFDVSHGCLNLDTANAIWFYNHSTIGDPVLVRHTGGPKITVSEGGDWSVPWSTWLAGSALH